MQTCEGPVYAALVYASSTCINPALYESVLWSLLV